MRNRLYRCLLAVGLYVILGCGKETNKFDGWIEFTNNGAINLWVDIEGFENNPPCGNLAPDATAASRMGPLKIPPKVTIVWKKEAGGTQRTELPIPVVIQQMKGGKLVFQFDGDQWSVSSELATE